MPKNITTIQAYVYPLLIALALPVFVGLFNPAGVADLLYWLVVIIAVITPPFILYRITYDWRSGDSGLLSALLKYIRPLPMGLVYRTDLKIRQRPNATICLILANAVIYFVVPTDLVKHFAFFPAGDPGIVQILVSVFTSAFLHGSIYHLLMNMVFLWVFGSVLEARIHTGRFLLVYFFSIAASNFLFFALLCFHLGFPDISSDLTQFHSIGASGAVAGVMGAFAVRCFFARLSVTLPFLFLPFVSVAFRVQAAVLIALFFAADIVGSFYQFRAGGQINYWAHVGGYVGAMVLGYLMGLQRAAASEALHVKAARLARNENSRAEAIKAYKEILEKNRQDEKALEFFFYLHQFDPQKQGEFFARWMKALAAKDFDRAKKVVDQHYPQHVNYLDGRMLLRLGTEYLRNAQLARAKLCLEHASQKSGPWQKKTLLALADVYARMELKERARRTYHQIIEHGVQPAGQATTGGILNTQAFAC